MRSIRHYIELVEGMLSEDNVQTIYKQWSDQKDCYIYWMERDGARSSCSEDEADRLRNEGKAKIVTVKPPKD